MNNAKRNWWVDDLAPGLKRYSILEGAHEADIGEAGVAYDLGTALRFAASEDLERALAGLLGHFDVVGEDAEDSDVIRAVAALARARGFKP